MRSNVVEASSNHVGSGRLDYVDGIRALAALYVVAHHIWLTAYPGYPHNDGPSVLGWLLYGHLAVAIFIAVSGFSLAIAPARRAWALRGGSRTFLRRRAWRILPTYWAALALSCIVFGLITPTETGEQVSAKAIVVHSLLLQDVINSPKPNGAFWSIAVEWQIYFLFPLFLLIRRRFGPVTLVVLATAGVIVAQEAATHIHQVHGLLNLTPQFAALCVFGMAAGEVVTREVTPRIHKSMLVFAALLVGVFVVLAAVRGSVWIDTNYFWIDLVVGTAAALVLAALAGGSPARVHAVLARGPLRRTGLFSYSIYCIHLPILWLVWHFGVTKLVTTPGAEFTLLVVLGLPAVLIGSYAFARVFEIPFLTHRSFASVRELLWRPRARTGTAVLGAAPSDG